MVPVKEIHGSTGYVRGGVSLLGMREEYQFHLDETAEILDLITVSAGQPGLRVLLSGPDLIRAPMAHLAPLTK